ncbi:hypothetical protein VCSRO187_3353 [Vibrio cholerae]|nr:hypothetical protein VCSRO187_3353 [Vibrio cholerae]
MKTLNFIEAFLVKLEENEKHVFLNCPEYIIVPLFPFFQLAYLLNLSEVLILLESIETESKGYIIRDTSNIALAYNEHRQLNEFIRYQTINILEKMRF